VNKGLRADAIREALDEFLSRPSAIAPQGRLRIRLAARPSLAPHSGSSPSSGLSGKKLRFTWVYRFRGEKPYVWVGKPEKPLLRSDETPRPAQNQPTKEGRQLGSQGRDQ
jgi:hypothetical protein